jgi:5,10-methylenetetrahydromethanopterin reductase
VTAEHATRLAGEARAASFRSQPPSSFRVAGLIPCCMCADVALAERTARETVLAYAMHPAIARLHAGGSFALEMAAVRRALAAEDRSAAVACVSDQLARAMVLHGPIERCGDGVSAYRAAGVDLPVIFPVAVDGDWDAAIRAGIEAFGD